MGRASVNPQGDWFIPAAYGAFFLCLFLAFSTGLESKFVLPKAMVLAAGVLVFGALLLREAWRGPVAVAGWALLPALALAAWWGITTPFALHVPTALHGEFNRYNGLWTHLCWLALFVAALCLPRDTDAVRRIAMLLVAAIAPVALLDVLEAAGLTSFGLREVSTLGDRVAVSALMNFAIPLSAIALLRARQWWIGIGLGFLLALFVLAAALSQGRGPWMGTLVAMAIVAAGLIRSRQDWRRVALLAAVLALPVAAVVALSPAVAGRLATLTRVAQDDSVGHRLVIYQAARRSLAEHPLAGIGLDNFRNAYPACRSPEDRHFHAGVVPTMVHNGYLQTAVTSGVPALLLYLALLASVLAHAIRALRREPDPGRRDLLLGLLAALSACLVQDLSGWLDMSVTSAFWIALGLTARLASPPVPAPANSPQKWVLAGIAALMLPFALFLLHEQTDRAAADARLFRAQSLERSTHWPEAESLLSGALAGLPGDSRTEMVAGQLYAARFAAANDVQAYARSRELLEASYRHNPYDRLRLFNIVGLETLALETGTIQRASEFALNAPAILARTDADNPAFHALRDKFVAAQRRAK